MLGSTQVTGLDVHDGRLRGVSTTAGSVGADAMVLCAGVGQVVARWLASSSRSSPWPTDTRRPHRSPPWPNRPSAAPGHPILRHQERALYFRTYGDRVGIGSYSHPPVPVEPDADRRAEPGRPDAFGTAVHRRGLRRVVDDAVALLPALGEAKLEDAMTGLFSFTADGFPLVGEAEAVRGLFVAEAVWVTHTFGVSAPQPPW